jgi:hypothetical protein
MSKDKISIEQKIACLMGMLPVLMDYMEDIKYDYPHIYTRRIKKSGNEFIGEVEKWTDKVYDKIKDNPEATQHEFAQHIVNVGKHLETFVEQITNK